MHTLKELITKEWNFTSFDDVKMQRIIQSIKVTHPIIVYMQSEYVCMRHLNELCINVCDKCKYGARL